MYVYGLCQHSTIGLTHSKAIHLALFCVVRGFSH